jgi:hypothetical protein
MRVGQLPGRGVPLHDHKTISILPVHCQAYPIFSTWNSTILDSHTKYIPPGYSYPILIMSTFFLFPSSRSEAE